MEQPPVVRRWRWRRCSRTGEGIGIGIALGVALGAAFNNLAIGIAIGAGIGAAFDEMIACRWPGKSKVQPFEDSGNEETRKR